MKPKIDYCFIVALLWVELVHGEQIWLKADGNSNTYALINSKFGGNSLELPDCAHQSFGPHITQRMDNELNHSVFIFHIHINSDNDRCNRDDRQRVEIKPPIGCPENLKGYDRETVSRWDTGEQLLSVTKNEIDLWRDGAEYARPKWGIYRSLATLDGLRDEDVYFDSFCLGKGTVNKCV